MNYIISFKTKSAFGLSEFWENGKSGREKIIFGCLVERENGS